jgi:hypothetical protein
MHPTRIFKTPEELEKVWIAYKADLKKKEAEWIKVQYVGKDGDKKEDSLKIPLTLEGLKRYCWDEKIGDISSYFSNDRGLYEVFTMICSRIKNEIRENQIIGGLVGLFNPSITQRLNNLADKSEINDNREPRVFKLN